MTEVRPPYDDEIDLFELFETLWRGKWKIITTTFVAALVGITFSFVQPNSYQVSTPIQNGKQSVFLPYIALNDLLKDKGLLFDSEKNSIGFSFNSVSVFEMFVAEFNDYEEMINVLSDNYFVKQSIEDLDETDKRRALINFAKSFALKPPSKNGESWLLSFEWHDGLEGARLLDDAIQQTLINTQKLTKGNIDNLASSVDIRNSFEVDKLRNELRLIGQSEKTRDKKKVQYLIEQSAIAKEIGIESNRLTPNDLSQNLQNGISLSVGSNEIPFYLRGYKAIDKEISLISNRSDEEALLMASGYIEIERKILWLENDLSSSQLRSSSQLIATDSPNKWVKYDLALADSKSQKKSKLYVALSIVLGGMIGIIFVLVNNSIRKRKESASKV
ncbi:Wzz/FepE/Etk N-terminal domain-containing protein [Marinomonas sp.]|uniref:Wzz/FepE/Etk N-terminal domain-containing protein n=1 Tax=Marinomonas sp. TaxID=1904862 RepID=UPI003BABEE45